MSKINICCPESDNICYFWMMNDSSEGDEWLLLCINFKANYTFRELRAELCPNLPRSSFLRFPTHYLLYLYKVTRPASYIYCRFHSTYYTFCLLISPCLAQCLAGLTLPASLDAPHFHQPALPFLCLTSTAPLHLVSSCLSRRIHFIAPSSLHPFHPTCLTLPASLNALSWLILNAYFTEPSLSPAPCLKLPTCHTLLTFSFTCWVASVSTCLSPAFLPYLLLLLYPLLVASLLPNLNTFLSE